MKYEVILEGVFTKSVMIEAKNETEAELKAKSEFDSITGMSYEDYVIDSVSVIPEEI